MMVDFLFLIGGFILLVLGGDWLLKSAVSISRRLGLSKMVVGLTVVSFATSAPELIVSINAALDGSSGIALGNVIGSNIANIGLVLGVTLLIISIKVTKKFLRTDWAFMVFSSLLLILCIYFDHFLSRGEGILFVILLSLYIYYLLRSQKNKKKNPEPEDEPEDTSDILSGWKTFLFLVLGGIALWLGAEWLVNGAKSIARNMNVPESVIGLTVVAVGTSVPELAASVIAALKKEKSISLGNLIGSNIFNILSVLGITAIIQPITVEDLRFIDSDIWWMLGFALSILPLSFLFKRYTLNFASGIILVTFYIIYVFLAFQSTFN